MNAGTPLARLLEVPGRRGFRSSALPWSLWRVQGVRRARAGFGVCLGAPCCVTPRTKRSKVETDFQK